MEKPLENDPDTNVQGEEEKVVFPKTDDEAPAAFASPKSVPVVVVVEVVEAACCASLCKKALLARANTVLILSTKGKTGKVEERKRRNDNQTKRTLPFACLF